MTPLDLTKEAPRSPREEIGGLCMLPRMIDVARGKLPGGNVGTYQIGRGMSGRVFQHLGIGVDEFVEAVRTAATDEEVAARFCGKRTKAEDRMLNLKMKGATVADVPADLRPSFEQFYGADLPPDRRIFDVLEEDDRCAFGAK